MVGHASCPVWKLLLQLFALLVGCHVSNVKYVTSILSKSGDRICNGIKRVWNQGVYQVLASGSIHIICGVFMSAA